MDISPPPSVHIAPPPPDIPPPPKPASKFIFLIGGLFILIVGLSGGYYLVKSNYKPAQKACTLEAKICPDGSSVGRTGSNCEFAPCPQITNTPTPISTPLSTPSTSLIPSPEPTSNSTAATPKTGNIEEIQTLLNNTEWVLVIVGLRGNEFTLPEFHDDVKKKSEVQKIQNAVLITLTKDDFQVGSQYQFIPSFAGRISKLGMEKLLRDPRVTSISIDRLSAPN